MIYNPVGKRAREVHREKSKAKDKGPFVKKGITQLYKTKGGKPVRVTQPVMGNPTASYGPRNQEGEGGEGESEGGMPQVGSGKGKEGQLIGLRPKEGDEGKQAGEDGDGHIYGEVSEHDIITYLKEELELEMIKPGKLMKFVGFKYPIIGKHGPESLFDLEETVKASFIRQALWEGKFSPGDLEEDDLRYKMAKEVWKEDKNAVVIFKRDVSGSVSEEEMQMSYVLTRLVEIWLNDCYKDQVESVYLPHNHEAWEDTKEGYYNLESSGGTQFSTAYNVVLAMLNGKNYRREEGVVQRTIDAAVTDIYLIDMSDGQDWRPEEAAEILAEIMPALTRFCYLQTSSWGDGGFLETLTKKFVSEIEQDKVRIYKMDDLNEVDQAMKSFFGKVS